LSEETTIYIKHKPTVPEFQPQVDFYTPTDDPLIVSIHDRVILTGKTYVVKTTLELQSDLAEGLVGQKIDMCKWEVEREW